MQFCPNIHALSLDHILCLVKVLKISYEILFCINIMVTKLHLDCFLKKWIERAVAGVLSS